LRRYSLPHKRGYRAVTLNTPSGSVILAAIRHVTIKYVMLPWLKSPLMTSYQLLPVKKTHIQFAADDVCALLCDACSLAIHSIYIHYDFILIPLLKTASQNTRHIPKEMKEL
jgi:hypothetical protein